jgi:hypothetical protein
LKRPAENENPSREGRNKNSKRQHPSSREGPSIKLQTNRPTALDFWVGASLVLGAWDLELSGRQTFNFQPATCNR